MQRQILLATDLSARCDRAFDRAVWLARAWDARLTIATAVEEGPDDAQVGAQPRWRRSDRALADAESQIRDDLRDKEVDADIVVRRARASELLLEVARAAPHDLIVTGIARSTGLARAVLGATVESLLGARAAPVLVVKRRAREAYRSALVGTDFSAGSTAALQATADLFPEAALTVLHAYHERSAGGLADRADSDDAARRHAYDDCARFVAQALSRASSGVQCVAEAGFPETLLNQYALDRGIDLISVGPHGRNLLLHALSGSTCRGLVLSSRCDLLLVPLER